MRCIVFLGRFIVLTLLFALVLSACAPAPAAPPASPIDPPTEASPTNGDEFLAETGQAVSGRLVIYSGRSEPLLQPVLDAFQANHPNVEILLKAGSNSELANALIEEQGNPQADVFITTEMFTVQSLAELGIFEPYLPAGSELLPAEFVGPDNLWVGLTRRARIIMYNTELVAPEDLPDSMNDLTDPRWNGQIAAAGSTNGGMQAHIAVLRQLVGEEETEAWLNGLIANDVTFFGGHTDVRKAVGAGEFALGLVNHYYYHLQLAEGSPVGIIYPDQGEGEMGLISNATAAGVVKGGANSAAAQAFIDFLISPEGQKLFAEENYEYPMLADVELRAGVQPLSDFRLVDINVAQAALERDETFDLIERVNLP
jgi:iron(III) transport system substrate-binding protein